MKQLWKRLKSEKGFTLVELLAVIVILGVILAIAIPAIGSVINKAEENTANNQDELILDAARLADVNGQFESSTTTIQDLIDNGYLEDFDSENTETIRSLTDVIYKNSDNIYGFEAEASGGTP